MRISGRDRREIRRTMLENTQPFRRVWLVLATETSCTSCGFDEMSNSGLDPTCATCEGLGKVVTFTKLEVRARIKVFDFVQLQGAGAAPPGVELGDMALYVPVTSQSNFDTLMSEERSYAKIEGDSNAYRPFSVSADGVGGVDEIRVVLKKTTMEKRATGY